MLISITWKVRFFMLAKLYTKVHKSAQKFLKVILCVCVPEKGVMTEPDEVKNNQCYTEMHFLKVDMAKRVISKSGFQCLQLYQTAIDR